MLVSEIFKSIQGESTYAGLASVFIRLAGCNLDCSWCDTDYARANGNGKIEGAFEMSADEIIKDAANLGARIITITGGEPLLQNDCFELIAKLLALSLTTTPFSIPHTIVLETNGSINLKEIDDRVVKVIDVKCPSSGVSDSFKIANLQYINPGDEIKFVIGDRADYEFARGFAGDHLLTIWEDEVGEKKEVELESSEKGRGIGMDPSRILFSPILKSLKASELAEWILTDQLDVRLQVQLHKVIWGENTRGV